MTLISRKERRKARLAEYVASITPRKRLPCPYKTQGCTFRFEAHRIESHVRTMHTDLLRAEEQRKREIAAEIEQRRGNVHTLADLGKVRTQFRPA